MTPNGKSRLNWVFGFFVVLYGALLFWQINHGLASFDAHGILQVVNALVDQHIVLCSRPPGHPATEFYLFGSVAWVLAHAFNRPFDATVYLSLQAIAGIVALVVFYRLLGRLGVAYFRATVLTICLAFSPQFFANAIDGEEFVFGLLFVLLAIRLLIVPQEVKPKPSRVLLSIFCFALATGCRPEIVFAGPIYLIWFSLHPRLGWKYYLASLPVQALAILIVWLPVLLFVKMETPYPSGMDLRASLLGGAYKVAFQCFTLPGFLVICWLYMTMSRDFRKRCRDPFPGAFVFLASYLLPLLFALVFFRFPTKPAYLLVAFAFVLVLIRDCSNTLVLTLTGATLVTCLVNMDIFQERHLVLPHFTTGTAIEKIRVKPFYKLAYLRELAAQCVNGPTVVIGSSWPWDFQYNIAHGTFAASAEHLTGSDHSDIWGFLPPGHNNACVLFPPNAATQSDILENYQAKGYQMKMERAVYHTLFARYDVGAISTRAVKVGKVTFELFSDER